MPFQHRLDGYPDKGFSPAIAVQLAEALYFENNTNDAFGIPPKIDIGRLKALGLDEKIDHWRTIYAETLRQGNEDE